MVAEESEAAGHPAAARGFRVVRLAGLAFLDAYVKGDARAKAWLRSDGLKKATAAVVRLEHK